ncbi:MAG: alpha/beta hydrolase [Gemmatimonadales bacterium]
MPLDPHAKRLLDMLAAAGAPGSSVLTPARMREAMRGLAVTVDAKGVPGVEIADRELPGSGGTLPVRVYTPDTARDGESAGIVYFHGGAAVFCSVQTHDGLCRLLAKSSGCRVISVEYRLAPEHAFPAAIEDAYFATRWVSDHARELGIDPARLAVAGDSAGATLATVTCMLARERGGPALALQLLFCPVTDLAAESASRLALGTGYFIERTTLRWAMELYCPPSVNREDPRISPLRARDLSGLPRAHVHTAEFDPMRDEGSAYAERLREAGVEVACTCHEGMIHNFYCMAGVIPRARRIVEEVGATVGGALRG